MEFSTHGDYDNLYALKGIQGKDLDGDGLKDLVVFAKYSYEGENGELLVDTVCTIYYQRTAGFEKDTDFTENYECDGGGYSGGTGDEDPLRRMPAPWLLRLKGISPGHAARLVGILCFSKYPAEI